MPALRAGSLPIIGQSTAELIEGSLKFNYKSYNLLTRTPGSAGNSNNWTLSWWHKKRKDIRCRGWKCDLWNDCLGLHYYWSYGV